MGMLLFLSISLLRACCGVTESTPMYTLCPSTSTDCIIDGCEPDSCKYKVEDVLCTGGQTEEYKKKSRECMYSLLCGKNSDVYCGGQSREQIFYKINCYLKERYQSSVSFEVFCVIWTYFNGDCNKIVVVMTHMIHNTSGFTVLTGWQRPGLGAYYSRGVLQIQGKENYEIAGQEYVNNPNLLASLSARAIIASLNVYVTRVPHFAQLTICDSWYYLNPEEIQGHNYEYDYYQQRIVDRLNVYRHLCYVFGIKECYGRHCYFLRRYL